MSQQAAPKRRDPRLDFFRGLCFIFIFIAHIPDNWWKKHIPAGYGGSDAADMFVFMSGFAAAIAFGGTYLRKGFWMGTARILHRCWQLYGAHLWLFFIIAFISQAATYAFDKDYISALALNRIFYGDMGSALFDLFTLTWVPNYFDILPMYLVCLALVPVMMLLSRVHVLLPVAASLALWLANHLIGFDLPADLRPGKERPWFFDPFGWQLIFFTGFALSRGWVKPPRFHWWLFLLCLGFIVLHAAAEIHWVIDMYPWIAETRPYILWRCPSDEIRPYLLGCAMKTDYGVVRWLHIMAGAYVIVNMLKGYEDWLPRLFKPIMYCGQQGLETFMFVMTLSRVAGMVLDQIGRTDTNIAMVNIGGILLTLIFARTVAWLKSNPWSSRQTPAKA